MHTSNLLQINWSFNWRYLILLSISRQIKWLFAISQYNKITLCKRRSIKYGSKFNWNIITNRFEKATWIYDIESRAVAQASNQKTVQSMNFFFQLQKKRWANKLYFNFIELSSKFCEDDEFFFSFDVFHLLFLALKINYMILELQTNLVLIYTHLKNPNGGVIYFRLLLKDGQMFHSGE